jgi:hypothetical protein
MRNRVERNIYFSCLNFWNRFHGQIHCNYKSKKGVGKTATAINLSASLGVLEKGAAYSADPQTNASSGLGINVDDVEMGTYVARTCHPG